MVTPHNAPIKHKSCKVLETVSTNLKAVTVTVAVISTIFFLNEERQFVEDLLVLLCEYEGQI